MTEPTESLPTETPPIESLPTGALLVQKGVRVPMPDGVELSADVYRPAAGGRYPVLLSRTPYGKEGLLHDTSQLDVLRMVAAGYVVVLQDCRGTGGSDGEFRWHTDEATDGTATVAWSATQPWSNGRIGMYGGSYASTTQYAVAIAAPGTVAAIAPSVAPSFYHGDLAYRGGAFLLASGLSWAMLQILSYDGRRAVAQDGGPGPGPQLPELATLVQHTPTATVPGVNRGPGQHYLTWLDHPAQDGYWDAIAYRDAYPRISTPALHVAGWYDAFLGGTLAAYRALREQAATPDARQGQRLIVGPWTHGNRSGAFPGRHYGLLAGNSGVIEAEHRAHFDRWLKGSAGPGLGPGSETIDPGMADPGKPVKIFVMGLDQWRDEDDWPLPDTDYRGYHLHSAGRANTAAGDGTLSTEPARNSSPDSFSTDSSSTDTYRYDPADPVPTCGGAALIFHQLNEGPLDQHPVETRSDVLCYTTAPLTAPLEVTGPVELILYVSTDVPDTDLTAALVDVHPDGRAELLTDGILRARYRNSFRTAEIMVPGEIYRLRIDLWATSNLFRTGHQIRLDVSSSSFPRYDRNTNTGGPIAYEALDAARTATVTVHHDAEHPSRLMLPVIARSVIDRPPPSG